MEHKPECGCTNRRNAAAQQNEAKALSAHEAPAQDHRLLGIRKYLLAIVVLTIASGGLHRAAAQPARLHGFVSDAETGAPMEFVNVLVSELADAAVEGAVTNSDGAYVFARLGPGRYVLQASFVGYRTFRDTLSLEEGEVRSFNFGLEPDAAALEEVVVEGSAPGGLATVTAGQQTIRPADVELVPSPDLSADLAGYLQTLPGIVTTGDRGGQLFIRGGEPSQNLVLLDGMPVFQPFHVLGFYSAFPADILRNAEVHAGGFGARYGARLSSVIDVASRNGNNRSYEGSVSLSPFVSALRVEGPVIPGNSSILISARQSLLEEAADRYVDARLPFRFNDVVAKVHAEPSATTRMSLTALNTYDRGALAELADDPEEVRWQNQAIGARIVTLPQLVPFVGAFTLSFSRLRSEMGPSGEPTRSSEVREVRATAIGSFYHGRYVDTEAGLEFTAVGLRSDLGGLFQDADLEDEGFQNMALFIEPNVTVVPQLSIRPGVRFHLYRLDEYPRPEPRLRIVWQQGAHQLSAASGLYHQELVGISDRRDAASVFNVWTIVRGVGERDSDVEAGRLARGLHALLGYRLRPAEGLGLSVEGFYKKTEDVFIAEWTSYPRLATSLQATEGRTFGFDARASYRAADFEAHVGYGYSNTEYEASRPRYEIWYGDETLRIRPSHDRRHQISVLISGTWKSFDVSAAWHFGSGLPFSRASGFGGFVLMEWPEVDVGEQGSRRVIYERPNNGILPTFHRLDVSVEHTFVLGPADVTVQASAINVYDRRNLFYLDVFTHERADQLPFVPSLGLEVAL